ncbi:MULTISPECIES: hypothetical protein [Priestia]|uniref:hypothetical protein n=1 Tax=Priestia TaxID=2800373 RepID=UPI0011B7E237|nr:MULTISPECIES: hypothetical protein [Priestia]QDZ88263.1 hypothetical protein D0441_28740 [Priestia megaterium]QTL52898.1 hypothetical protein J5Z55_30605 [Priestia aryabhattai]
MKKLTLVFILIFAMALPNVTEAKGFSGHSSFSHNSSFSSHSSRSTYSSGPYHSGYKSPSSNVTRTPSYSKSHTTYNQTQPSRTKSILTHAAAFGAGAFLGHMLHPFGGSYNGAYGNNDSNGFSFLGILVDILVILIIIWVIKSIFTRRRY